MSHAAVAFKEFGPFLRSAVKKYCFTKAMDNVKFTYLLIEFTY